MAQQDVDLFVRDHAKDKKKLKDEFKNNPDAALARAEYKGLSADEKALLKRKNAHEIKEYLKDAYGASLSVNIP